MEVWLVTVDPNDYENDIYVLGIYSTEEKAINAIQAAAIENNEPALLLEHNYDSWQSAELYHYPDYEFQRYYIYKTIVE